MKSRASPSSPVSSIYAGALVRLDPDKPFTDATAWSRPLEPDRDASDRLAHVHTMRAHEVALVLGTLRNYALIVVAGRLGWVNEGYLTCVE